MTTTADIQKAINDKVKYPDYWSISGSRLYGTNRPSSDYDYRGFVLPPKPLLIDHTNNIKFQCINLPQDDAKIYSINRFLSLAINGDPQLTELLFTPPQFIKTQTEVGKRIISMRDKIISNRIYKRVTGYGYSEWRKACGQKLVLGTIPQSDQDIINTIRDHKKWDKDRIDQFIEWMNEDRDATLIDSRAKLGMKRNAEFNEFGFGVSSAAHAIRLTEQITELMTTGHITFPRPNADFLRSIREGKHQLNELQKYYDDALEQANKAIEKSVLPNKPDLEFINNEYEQIVMKALGI